jgi:hypothetical protein
MGFVEILDHHAGLEQADEALVHEPARPPRDLASRLAIGAREQA